MAADVHIRQALEEDCPLLAELLIATYQYYGDRGPHYPSQITAKLRSKLGASPGFEALIVEVRGEAVGYAIYAPVFWTSDCEIALFLKEIFILQEARGLGLGKLMMSALSKEAKDRGWPRLVWTVDRRNYSALRFYRAIKGSREVNKDVYILDGEDLMANAAIFD
ncbi:N-acetyltransferase family protein [Rhodovibrionaceae bacterium A322]